jgi:hypothetical protein
MTYAYDDPHGCGTPSARRRRRALVARIAALASLAAASFPAVAAADQDSVSGGAGLYLSFTFGAELGIGYGVEGHFIAYPDPPMWRQDTVAGLGGLLQIGGINASKFRYVVAAQAGGLVDGQDSIGLLGELGLAGHVVPGAEDPHPLGIHTGFLLQTPIFLTGFVRAEWLLDEYSVGNGVRIPPTFQMPLIGPVDGRPLRTEEGVVTLCEAARGAAANGRAPDCEDASIADAWARDAQAEAASVPAFLQLAAELLAHGAPHALVARALDAAEDEIRHAYACARMASRLSGTAVRPVLPDVAPRPPLAGPAGIARLAVESWLDGCVGEGAAAERAGLAARAATDPTARRTRARIARDEARHADLGWHVLAWSIVRGGEDVAAYVRAHRDVEPATADQATDRGERLGVLGRADVEAGLARHTHAARDRLDRLLAPRAT